MRLVEVAFVDQLLRLLQDGGEIRRPLPKGFDLLAKLGQLVGLGVEELWNILLLDALFAHLDENGLQRREGDALLARHMRRQFP
jgi:hypothetical protein